MSSAGERCGERLGQWTEGLVMPALDDPRRRLEELSLKQLRNFLVLMLASRPAEPWATPAQALAELAPDLSGLSGYQERLALPMTESPDAVITPLQLGMPDSELFQLQERLSEQLSDDGRLVVLQLGSLF